MKGCSPLSLSETNECPGWASPQLAVSFLHPLFVLLTSILLMGRACEQAFLQPGPSQPWRWCPRLPSSRGLSALGLVMLPCAPSEQDGLPSSGLTGTGRGGGLDRALSQNLNVCSPLFQFEEGEEGEEEVRPACMWQLSAPGGGTACEPQALVTSLGVARQTWALVRAAGGWQMPSQCPGDPVFGCEMLLRKWWFSPQKQREGGFRAKQQRDRERNSPEGSVRVGAVAFLRAEV